MACQFIYSIEPLAEIGPEASVDIFVNQSQKKYLIISCKHIKRIICTTDEGNVFLYVSNQEFQVTSKD